ncbi:hypothetical protein ACN47E_007198 [Coniothyrium glycines]
MARWNPFSFTPGPVMFFVTATYIALFAALLVVHLNVPSYPANARYNPHPGQNLTEAWLDLDHITRRFHPFNSHANDRVHDYLLSRINHVIAAKKLGRDRVYVLDDNTANVTYSNGATSVYFEGTNIIVAIRGSDDDEPIVTNRTALPARRRNNGGVLVNAHYDSVSSGYGATDDGVGVVTVLQLLSYFTDEKNWPKRTVVLLLNNGEEDFLNGAVAFMRNPTSAVPQTFVNLEGAGAGGRATLFRSTDTEVTRYYKKASHPFGTVVSGDGFKKKLVRSETDYKIFYGELGLRGLDIAFFEPRARYHTIEDTTRETSLNSVWHMLSAAISSTAGLASVTGEEFAKPNKDRDDPEASKHAGSDAVWFDLFGKVFVVFQLHTFFALCVSILVVAPLTLIGLSFGLSKAGKNYLFARKAYVYSADDDHPVHLYGWRGFFRFPIVFATATAIVVALAYLVVRVNPYIIYSSPYAIWSMMLSAWFSVAWFFSRGADAMRPSALHRMYALIWLFIGSFVLLALVTVLANNYQLAAGYPALFCFAACFVAMLISYLELFGAPSKSAYARHVGEAEDASEPPSRPLTGSTTAARSEDRPLADDDATETTSLLRGERRSFRRYGTRRGSADEHTEDHDAPPPRVDPGHAYPGEQEWSGKLPSWIWIIQFLVLAPIVTILVGQIALLLTSALYQTPSDGNSPLFIYVSFAVLSVLLLAPTGPFIHRFTYHIPVLLFLVCVGTVIYNLVAFPFSREHRLKIYFVQQVDCDNGTNTVTLNGLDGYINRVIADIPSAHGTGVVCEATQTAARQGLEQCSWSGIQPKVVPTLSTLRNTTQTSAWVEYSAHRVKGSNNATFHVLGQNTRSCRIVFDMPITGVAIDGAVSDPRFDAVGQTGSREVRLWHRAWSQPWNVSVSWDAKEHSKLSGKVVCLWSDANAGAIPAFDEVLHYLPVWAIPTKLGDGLVEGYKYFEL